MVAISRRTLTGFFFTSILLSSVFVICYVCLLMWRGTLLILPRKTWISIEHSMETSVSNVHFFGCIKAKTFQFAYTGIHNRISGGQHLTQYYVLFLLTFSLPKTPNATWIHSAHVATQKIENMLNFECDQFKQSLLLLSIFYGHRDGRDFVVVAILLADCVCVRCVNH